MENFFVDDDFFESLNELFESYFDDEQDVYDLDDLTTFNAREGVLKKLFDNRSITKDFLIDSICDFNDYDLSQANNWEKEVSEILNKYISIDTNSIERELPEVYFPHGTKFTITKQDLINHIERYYQINNKKVRVIPDVPREQRMTTDYY